MSDVAAGRVAAIIPAAGSGTRLGADVPKAFILLDGMSLLTRSAMAMSRVADVIVVAAPDGFVEEAIQHLAVVDSEIHVVVGGADRQESVSAGLRVVPEDVTVVLVHDAARPLVPLRVTQDIVQAVRDGASGAIPVIAVVDTIKRVDALNTVVATIPRDSLRRVQTPQGFSRSVLDSVLSDPTHTATDDAGLLEAAGIPVVCVEGDERAMKITTSSDYEHALHLLLGEV